MRWPKLDSMRTYKKTSWRITDPIVVSCKRAEVSHVSSGRVRFVWEHLLMDPSSYFHLFCPPHSPAPLIWLFPTVWPAVLCPRRNFAGRGVHPLQTYSLLQAPCKGFGSSLVEHLAAHVHVGQRGLEEGFWSPCMSIRSPPCCRWPSTCMQGRKAQQPPLQLGMSG